MKKNILIAAISIYVVSIFAYAAPVFAAWGKIGEDVRITNDTASSVYPSIVWTGTEYGVSWQDYRSGDTEIYFTRINATGNKVGNDIKLTGWSGYSEEPSLVWTGTEYGLSWEDLRGVDPLPKYEIYFARLDSQGNKIGDDVRITYAEGNNWADSHDPSLVWTGTEYGVSWWDLRSSNPEIYFVRIDAGGNKIGDEVRISNTSGKSGQPSLAWTGIEYGVSWDKGSDAANSELYFTRLDSSGNKIDGDIRITNASGQSYASSLAWNGTEYGVAWCDNRDGNFEIYFARIDSLGNKISSETRITNNGNNSRCPSLVWNGSEYGVSWYDDRDGNEEIYFARIDASANKIGSDIRITNAAGRSYYPSLVWTGTEYGVSWHDDRDGNATIYFARIGQTSQEPIPTLSEWGLIILAVIMLSILVWRMRRQYSQTQ